MPVVGPRFWSFAEAGAQSTLRSRSNDPPSWVDDRNGCLVYALEGVNGVGKIWEGAAFWMVAVLARNVVSLFGGCLKL